MAIQENKLYHLWLKPETTAHVELSELIRQLSQTYNTRLFDPHVTLLGNITGSEADLITKTAEVSKQVSRITATIERAAYLNEFYRSLFLLVKPTAELINANTYAKQAFRSLLNESFMPHLSLLYGNIPVDEKETIIKKLNSRLFTPFYLDKIVLFCTSNDPVKWYPVQSFPLVTAI